MKTKDIKHAFVAVITLCITCVTARSYAQTPTEHSDIVTQEEAIRVSMNYLQVRDEAIPILAEVRTEKVGDTICVYNVCFSDGQWILISASKSCVPILAHGYADTTADSIDAPEAFLYIVDWYKTQIGALIRKGEHRQDFRDSWNGLLNSFGDATPRYNPGYILLRNASGLQMSWGQTTNNDGGCIPSYNQYCTNLLCKDCGKAPAGCAAVAMGQIMWYWQWPKVSSYRTYSWMGMPVRLRNGETQAGDNIANLLDDCGDACSTIYTCPGSGALICNIEDAFYDEFAYKSVKVHYREDWETSLSWESLIKSEIDNNRPVLYYGDKSIITNGHYFIIDGYESTDYYSFHINFGHKGSFNGYFYLGYIHEGDDSYSFNQKAITGISPSYSSYNVSTVNYTTVTRNNREIALNSIYLPSSGNSLTVNNHVNYLLEAGNDVTLRPGFHAKSGSETTIRVNQELQDTMAISVVGWPNIIPYGGALWLQTHNADSWEFQAFDASNDLIYQSAGSITDDHPCVWDGTGMVLMNHCIIRLKNSYGRFLENDYWVYMVSGNKNDSNMDQSDTVAGNITRLSKMTDESKMKIYPNPTYGTVTVLAPIGCEISKLKVINEVGGCVFSDNSITGHTCKVDMSHFASGTYILQVETTDGKMFSERIVTKK